MVLRLRQLLINTEMLPVCVSVPAAKLVADSVMDAVWSRFWSRGSRFISALLSRHVVAAPSFLRLPTTILWAKLVGGISTCHRP